MDGFRSEELIKDFCRALAGTGLSKENVKRHRDKLRFFLYAYVVEEWPRELDRVTTEILRDFLGEWFPRHIGGTHNDVLDYLAVFRRFYEHLYHTGRITSREFDDLIAVCTARDYFLACHDRYYKLGQGRSGSRPGVAPRSAFERMTRGYDGYVDFQLWMLIQNLERPPAPATLDFALFLDYLVGSPLRLTRAQSRIPRVHLDRINQRFSEPEDLGPREGLDSLPRLNWFYQLARREGLIQVKQRNSVKVMPRGEAFLDLGPELQLAVILESTWNRVAWSDLGPEDSRRVSSWAQEHRDGFAALLCELLPERERFLDPEPRFDREDALLARYIIFHEVVERVILFALRETGVMNFTAVRPTGRTLAVKSITMTRFGRQVVRLLARRAAPGSRILKGPVHRLQESLFL